MTGTPPEHDQDPTPDNRVPPAEDLTTPAEEALAAEREAGEHTALPPKMEAWRKRSATGAILTGLALGFQQAFETERKEPAIVIQTSGAPPKDLPVEADFEFRRPRQSTVSVRPWLLGDSVVSEEAAESGTSDSDDPEAGPTQPGQ